MVIILIFNLQKSTSQGHQLQYCRIHHWMAFFYGLEADKKWRIYLKLFLCDPPVRPMIAKGYHAMHCIT